MGAELLNRVDFAKQGGLAPAIVQDAKTLQVLMLAYVNRETLAETLESGQATFYSRSRGGRWRKGETSGHFLNIVGVELDCDNDTLLFRVDPVGPACHRGTLTCFDENASLGIGRLGELEKTIAARASAPPEESWTAKLVAKGPKRIAQKVGEEGVETALAAVAGDVAELNSEAADLLYHLAVLLYARGSSLDAVMDVLAARADKKK
jgi:phosphoribosyl-AMP cyclohydrolase / phosphoribosyl-ATP pyrophosphohydrolase